MKLLAPHWTAYGAQMVELLPKILALLSGGGKRLWARTYSQDGVTCRTPLHQEACLRLGVSALRMSTGL
jgi:hypothetical protein